MGGGHGWGCNRTAYCIWIALRNCFAHAHAAPPTAEPRRTIGTCEPRAHSCMVSAVLIPTQGMVESSLPTRMQLGTCKLQDLSDGDVIVGHRVSAAVTARHLHGPSTKGPHVDAGGQHAQQASEPRPSELSLVTQVSVAAGQHVALQ